MNLHIHALRILLHPEKQSRKSISFDNLIYDPASGKCNGGQAKKFPGDAPRKVIDVPGRQDDDGLMDNVKRIYRLSAIG